MEWTVFFMKKSGKLRRWELALALAVCLSFGQAMLSAGGAGCHWWGVIFPGLTELGRTEQTETAAFAQTRTAEERVLRLRLLDWLRELGILDKPCAE